MLKDAIALELFDELLMGNCGFIAALGDNGQVVQVLDQLLIVRNWQDDGGALAALVGKILKRLAHQLNFSFQARDCRDRSGIIVRRSSIC